MNPQPHTIKRKPEVLSVSHQSGSARLTLKVRSDIIDFQGHFPQFALLPGVTQIDWAIHYAVTTLGVPPDFLGMEVIKFQEPILPGSTVDLWLEWDEVRQKLAFRYTRGDGENQVTHSSGKMKLGADQEGSRP